MEKYHITNDKGKLIAELFFLAESLVDPGEENQFDYMVSLLDQLPVELKEMWLQGKRGEVLENKIFHDMFEHVDDLAKIKKFDVDEVKIVEQVRDVIIAIVNEISFEPHKYYFLPKFSETGVSAFCYTAASTFIFVSARFSSLELSHVVAHEYFHAAIKYHELIRQQKNDQSIFYNTGRIKDQIINEGLADQFADRIVKVDSSQLYKMDDGELAKMISSLRDVLDTECEEKIYEEVFLKKRSKLFPGREFVYGAGYHIGYNLAKQLVRKYTKDHKVGWSNVISKPLGALFDESIVSII